MFGDKKQERRELSVIHECAAESCTYNENHICEAGEIDVMPTERGPICATYEPETDEQPRVQP